MLRLKTLVLAALLAFGAAFAQGRLYGEALGGELALAPNFELSLGVQAGAEEVLGPVGLRGGLSVLAGNNATLLGFAVDALYPLPLELAQNLKVDVGLGLGLTFASVGGASSTDFGIRGLIGLEVPVQGALALRLEPTFTYLFDAQQATFGIQFGPRVYLK
ncbi:hypothetical protein GCM10007092_00400 [Thermus composti]|uniref:Outer membrane protein beta-barrel domain-containing protein n=1 Tax=Thermus composti TaxID=532059 RepID=A0ABV6PZP5_9DEIN|nr:hypothetical protein [Thermus composti]GGM91360.1 hypothetical protein GCM10007092_00400 [Thermus composti]